MHALNANANDNSFKYQKRSGRKNEYFVSGRITLSCSVFFCIWVGFLLSPLLRVIESESGSFVYSSSFDNLPEVVLEAVCPLNDWLI